MRGSMCELATSLLCRNNSVRCHDELSKSSVPFVCYGCSLLTHRSEISRLESEIVSLKSVVAGLRSAINDTKDSSERASWSAGAKEKEDQWPFHKAGTRVCKRCSWQSWPNSVSFSGWQL